MTTTKASVFIVLLVSASVSLYAFRWSQRTDKPACALVHSAIASAAELKPGATRADVERNFELDGGLQFTKKSTYSLKACHSIKIEVEFSAEGIEERAEPLSTDKVVSVSKPYLEYPFKD